ncbi:adenosylcobinamide-GDP ribazoletransferase [Lachnospiraceae bacterium 29-84]
MRNNFINACIIAFAMYSKIPMPKVEWEKENMKYVMCFFPWVGAAVGLCFYFWGMYAGAIPVGRNLYAAVLTGIPVVVTGGIHLDGLLDTADALGSWQPRERRLEILKDPHAGAFAVIAGCLYFLTWFGLASELEKDGIWMVSAGFFLSRCFSGYSVTAFPCAKGSGLAAAFAKGADQARAGAVLLAELGAAMALMVWADPWQGVAAILSALAVFTWYFRMSKKKFGGITGDLAGCFLQICELAILAAVVAVQKI